jgi:hypothetical protein
METNLQSNDSKQYAVVGGILLATVLILGGGLWFMRPAAPVRTIADPSALPGLQTGNAPWTAALDNLKARLNAVNLPALTAEGTALHIHQHIDLYINGAPVTVPAAIGVDAGKTFISPLHTHDNTQVIHVESATVQDFTLGQFFDVWGVKLTADCVGGYCASGDKKLQVFSNGAPYTGNPRDLVLTAHQEIVVAYGTDAELPNPIPSAYTFPPNE